MHNTYIDYIHNYRIVIVFQKTDLMVTNIEIHFLPVDENHTYALSRDTMHLRLRRWTSLLLQVAFLRRCKTTRAHFMACVALEGH